MVCRSCQHAREIIKYGASHMMMKFTGEDSRKQFYIDNVNRTYQAYKAGHVPYDWFGFVHRMSLSEFKIYFEEDLNSQLDPELVEETAAYKFDADHGLLFKVLLDKFKN